MKRRRLDRRSGSAALPVALFIVFPALFVLGLVVAATLLPGLEINGVWAYGLTAVILWCVSEATSLLMKRTPLQPQ